MVQFLNWQWVTVSLSTMSLWTTVSDESDHPAVTRTRWRNFEKQSNGIKGGLFTIVVQVAEHSSSVSSEEESLFLPWIVWAIDLESVSQNLWGIHSTWSTVSWIFFTDNMSPAIRWNELLDLSNSISNKHFKATWVPSQPVENYSWVCPCISVINGNL